MTDYVIVTTPDPGTVAVVGPAVPPPDTVYVGTTPYGDLAAETFTTYRTDMTTEPGTVYVGVAPVGSAETDSVWRIWKIVEADSHPLQVPTDGQTFIHQWSDRTQITYAVA